jgi:hypothetical protein
MYIIDRHFYGEDCKRYIYKDYTHTEKFTVADLFDTLTKWHRECEFLNRYANYEGVHIYNMSDSSYIDAYERPSAINKKGNN